MCNRHIRLPLKKKKKKQPRLYLLTLVRRRSDQNVDVTSRRHTIEIPAELPCSPPPLPLPPPPPSRRCDPTSPFHLRVVTAGRTFHSDFPRNSFALTWALLTHRTSAFHFGRVWSPHLKLTRLLTSPEPNSEDGLSRAAAAAAAASERRGASPRWAAPQTRHCPDNAQEDLGVVCTMI